MMGNDLDRNCPDLASPARSWRNSITNKGFAVFFPSSSCFSKAAHTCYVLLHVGYVSCYVSATFPATYQLRVGYKAAGPAPFWHQRMRLAHVRSRDDGRARTASCQITPGEPGRAADRQAFASLSYPTHRQVVRNPHVGRSGFLVSMSIHPRTAVRRGRHAGLVLLRKSGPELAGWPDNSPRPPLVAGGALLSGGRASVVPDPVRRHRHRRAVVRSHVLITGDECRRTSRGRHSAPRAPRGSGATIPGTQRRPGQTHTRARGTIEARPPTRHTPPATKTTKRPLNFHHSGCREAA